jgi:hypothetical protein
LPASGAATAASAAAVAGPTSHALAFSVEARARDVAGAVVAWRAGIVAWLTDRAAAVVVDGVAVVARLPRFDDAIAAVVIYRTTANMERDEQR